MLLCRTSFTTLAALLLGLGTAEPPASANITTDETSTVPAGGTFVVEGHGWGRGRGLSQYGAQGGASLGKAADQITAFSHPSTARTSRADALIRVLLQGDAGADTQVWGSFGRPSGVQVTLSSRVG